MANWWNPLTGVEVERRPVQTPMGQQMALYKAGTNQAIRDGRGRHVAQQLDDGSVLVIDRDGYLIAGGYCAERTNGVKTTLNAYTGEVWRDDMPAGYEEGGR